MKILVTGSAGFLGSWVARSLVERGHTVVGVDNLVGGELWNIPTEPSYTHHFTNLLHLKSVVPLAEGCQAIYHCAALAYEGLSVFCPSVVVENIVKCSVNVMVAAVRQKVPLLINCSSMARYGTNPVPYTEDMLPQPVDPYGAAKVAAEQQLNILGSAHGVQVVHLVPHNIIGPGQRYVDPYRNVAAIMINRLLQNKSILIYGDGTQIRCFSPITDVLPTLLAILEEPTKHGEVFNIGPDDEPVEIGKLANLLMELTGVQFPIEYFPGRPLEVKVALCSSNKIRQRFGYQRQQPLEACLRELINYVHLHKPQPFIYHLPLEITERAPCTWKERLF